MKQTTAALMILLTGAATQAQPRRPKADVTPIVDTDRVRAGTTVHVTLRVNLPAGFHVQADKPRDPSLIPTVLTLTPPSGIAVSEIVYPKATDLKQAGQKQPLAVFEETFVIGATLTLGPSIEAGDVTVPARLRYQACDASSCYAPASETVQWTLHVVPADVK
jgi:DsbC/DsbD-like thiol-disulfide interchange protein